MTLEVGLFLSVDRISSISYILNVGHISSISCRFEGSDVFEIR